MVDGKFIRRKRKIISSLTRDRSFSQPSLRLVVQIFSQPFWLLSLQFVLPISLQFFLQIFSPNQRLSFSLACQLF
jgi:hypothetical protein